MRLDCYHRREIFAILAYFLLKWEKSCVTKSHL